MELNKIMYFKYLKVSEFTNISNHVELLILLIKTGKDKGQMKRRGSEGSGFCIRNTVWGWWQQQCVMNLGKLAVEGTLRRPERLGYQLHGTNRLIG